MRHREIKSSVHGHTASVELGCELEEASTLPTAPPHFSLPPYSQEGKEYNVHKANFQRTDKCSAPRLSGPMECEQWLAVTEVYAAGAPGTDSQGQSRMETLYGNKLQQLSKAGRKLSPQISSDLSTRREGFQDEAISGKFLDLTSNYLLAISPADVMESECVSHWKKLSRNISATQ